MEGTEAAAASRSARTTTKRGSEAGLPETVVGKFEVTSYRHASTILKHDFPDEYDDLVTVLADFSLPYTQLIVGGGGKGPIAVEFDAHLKSRGWGKKRIPVSMIIDGVEHRSPTHEIDLFKHRIAVEMEWNNKDTFYDRDLDNFRKLHGLGAISVGVIVTRATGLVTLFSRIDALLADCPFEYVRVRRGEPRTIPVTNVMQKYGQSHTHADKLYPKIEGGAGGQCPILVCAIKDGLGVGVDDYSPLIAKVQARGADRVRREDLTGPALDVLQFAEDSSEDA